MKFKIIFFVIISFLIIFSSIAIYGQMVVEKSPAVNIDKGETILEVGTQIDQSNSSIKNIYTDLSETKTVLNEKIESEVSKLNSQIDSAEEKIADLSRQLEELRENYSDIFTKVMSTNWTQAGMFWVSIFLVIITLIATYINYRVFRSQTDPDVIVYSTPDNRRPTIINLIIENIGKGVAKNILFSSNRPIPCRAFGLDDNAQVPKEMTTGPLITGIPELGPGAKRIITWGQYHGLLKGIGDDILTITANYESAKGFFKIQKFKPTYFLDVKSFEGTDASDQNWDKKAAESLGNIAESIKSLVPNN